MRSNVTHWVQLLLKGGKYGPDYGHPMTADLFLLFHDVVSGSEMTSYVKIDKPLVVYRFWERYDVHVHNGKFFSLSVRNEISK